VLKRGAIGSLEDCRRFCGHVIRCHSIPWHFPGLALIPPRRRRVSLTSNTCGVPSYLCTTFRTKWTKLAWHWRRAFPQPYQDPSVPSQIIPMFPAPPSTLVHAADDLWKPMLRVSNTSHLPKKRSWSTLCYKCLTFVSSSVS
jgi:hypothetical protein